jgi:hypothetical protein
MISAQELLISVQEPANCAEVQHDQRAGAADQRPGTHQL